MRNQRIGNMDIHYHYISNGSLESIDFFYCAHCETGCRLDDAVSSEIDPDYFLCSHRCQHEFDQDLHAEYARKINKGELC